MLEPESDTLEYKREMSDSFLKTVSAFANFHDGTIIFGVNDDRTVQGIADPIQFAEKLTNKINDRVSPLPDYTIQIDQAQKLIVLNVKKGLETPYMVNHKAYCRRNASTVEVDRTTLGDLILKGRNLSFDALESRNKDLTFKTLEKECQAILNIEKLGSDTLKTLGLLTKIGYTRAAELLADRNNYPGIDIVGIGSDINTIRFRKTFEKCSILDQFAKSTQVFEENYTEEKIDGFQRKLVEKVSKTAFREAVANALIHRNWDNPSQIIIKMKPDQIEITSSGGLPEGISESDYLEDSISMPRNPLLAYVFLRLGYIERLGTGIARIQNAYRSSLVKPQFQITPTRITVILPVFRQLPSLSLPEKELLEQMPKNILLSLSLIHISEPTRL